MCVSPFIQVGRSYEFDFVCGDRRAIETPTNWQKTVSREKPSTTGKQNKVDFTEPDNKLHVTYAIKEISGFPAVERVLRFKNDGIVDSSNLQNVLPLNTDCDSSKSNAPLGLHCALESYQLSDKLRLDDFKVELPAQPCAGVIRYAKEAPNAKPTDDPPK